MAMLWIGVHGAGSVQAAPPCTSWPGEPSPLPTLETRDPFHQQWARLRVDELMAQAREAGAKAPQKARELLLHARCIGPQHGGIAAALRGVEARIAGGTPADADAELASLPEAPSPDATPVAATSAIPVAPSPDEPPVAAAVREPPVASVPAGSAEVASVPDVSVPDESTPVEPAPAADASEEAGERVVSGPSAPAAPTPVEPTRAAPDASVAEEARDDPGPVTAKAVPDEAQPAEVAPPTAQKAEADGAGDAAGAAVVARRPTRSRPATARAAEPRPVEIARANPAPPTAGPVLPAVAAAPLTRSARPASEPAVDTQLVSALRGVEQLVHSAHFRKALESLEALRPRVQAGRGADAARLEVLAATAEIALGLEDAARASFWRALEAKPGLELDGRFTSPKVLRAFEAARENWPGGRG